MRSSISRTTKRVIIVLLAVWLAFSLSSVQASALGGGRDTSAQVSGPTEVGGPISSNTTWSLAGSPYIATSSIWVMPGVTLTIEPGVTVKFNDNLGMLVDGQVVARGTSRSLVTFTSSRSSPASGSWAFIKFTDSSVDATFDEDGTYLSGSILEHAVVEYAGSTGNGAIWLDCAAPFISRSIIHDNSRSGVYATYSPKLQIVGNTIYGNTASPWGGGIFALAGTVVISGNSGHDNGGGIFVYGIDATSIITCNTVVGNTAPTNSGGGIAVYSNPAAFDHNNVFGNTGYDLYNLDSSNITATDNWWGTADAVAVAAEVYDFFKDASKGVVVYNPCLTTPASCAPPSPPTGLVPTPGVSTVSLSWNANSEADIAGYKVYYDTDSGLPYQGTDANEGDSPIDVGNVTGFVLSSLGSTCYLAVTAYDADGNESWYSEEVNGTPVQPAPPNQPNNILPAEGATDIAVTPALQSTDFSDPDAGDAHTASQWQITTAPGDYSGPIFDSGTDTVNLTRITIPPGILSYGTAHSWRVRHRDSYGVWSEWSAETTFTTMWLPGDVNRDSSVDLLDLAAVAAVFNSGPPANPNTDLNKDGIVDVFDLVVVGANYGKFDSSQSAQ